MTTTDLPDPETLTTPPGSVLVLRAAMTVDAYWDDSMRDALLRLHEETGLPVVFLDSSSGLDLAVQTRAEAVNALDEALTEAHIAEVADEDLGPTLLEHLAGRGWGLVRLSTGEEDAPPAG